MFKKYSKEEINQILLSKQLNDFYLAIMEKRPQLLTDAEFAEIKKREKIITGDGIAEIKNYIASITTNKHVNGKNIDELMKLIFSLAEIRYMSILTMIGDEVYNICSTQFEDLKSFKIIHYDNFTNYYNESNARIKVFTPKEEPRLNQNTVSIDIADDKALMTYQNNHIKQEESEDLTFKFLSEVQDKPYTLAREKKSL